MSSPGGAPLYPSPGALIDEKYRVERVLGQGGMGAVLKATHVLRRAPVALKFMSPQISMLPGVAERFLNEGVAISRIDCEQVVKVFDVSRLPTGEPYLVMEYLEGEDLAALLAREGVPWLTDIPRAIHFVLQVLRGLQIAHRAGIVHRDMKPANCFVLQKEDQPDAIKLLDFGISKVKEDDAVHLTGMNVALGTPLYMSPEQAMSSAEVDTRTDLYSTGVILYELVCGRVPFVSTTGAIGELLFQIFQAPPPPPQTFRPDLPPDLSAVLLRALAKAPDARYQDAAQMAEALAPFADGRSAEILHRLFYKAGQLQSLAPPPLRSPLPPLPSFPARSASAPPAASAAQVEPTLQSARDPARIPSAVVGRAAQPSADLHVGRATRSRTIATSLSALAILAAIAVGGWIALRSKGAEVSPPAADPTSDPSTKDPSAETSAQAPPPANPEVTAEPTTSTPAPRSSAIAPLPAPTVSAVATGQGPSSAPAPTGAAGGDRRRLKQIRLRD